MRRAGALLALAAAVLPWSSAAAQEPPRAILVLGSPGIGYEQAIADPQLRAAAASGGVGLMTTRGDDPVEVVLDGRAEGDGDLLVEAVEDADLTVARVPGADADLVLVGPGPVDLPPLLAEASGAEILLVVAFPEPSPSMRERGDVVTPLVVARGSAGELLEEGGAVAGLTSETTRREGLVANVDLAPTILRHLGVPIPVEMTGSPIEVRGEAPGDLHARVLDIRAVRLPLQLLALAVAVAALVAVLLFLRLRPIAPEVAGALGGWVLIAIALPIAVLPVSLLPSVTWVAVVGLVALLTTAIVAGAWVVGRRDPTAAVALVGAAGVVLLALDALRGWPAMMTPVVGGGAFDGARFYGIGNVYAGVLLAGAVLLAAHLRRWVGVGLLAAAALLAGLPGLGANLGGAATLFAAAGLWAVLRLRRRLGVVEVGLAAAVAFAGTALVVATHRLLASEASHIARAAEEAGRGGPGALLEMVGDRLALNLEVTSRVPIAWLVIVALVVAAVVAGRRLGHLARDPEWRDACLVLALSGLVAFVVNDTGIGPAGLAFTYVGAALAYPALEERWTRS